MRYRVYPPFLVRTKGAPITEDVPRQLWPSFRWHECVPKELRGEQTAPPDFWYNTKLGERAIWYDGLRVDVWGPGAQDHVSPFVRSFMRWLRHLSFQPWISDVDRHYASTRKRSFPIDMDGAALDQAAGFSEATLTPIRLVSDTMWRSAFELATCREVPLHSNLFFDALNAAATDDPVRGIMNLAMSLESCRDLTLSRLGHAHVSTSGAIRLKTPFNHSDLLKHLSRDASQAFGRDFSVEHPNQWLHLRQLYKLRGQVAHGKPVTLLATGASGPDPFWILQSATAAALRWMELLPVNNPVSADDKCV